MDYTQLLKPLFNVHWYVIPLTILLVVVKSREAFLNPLAKLLLDRYRYHIIVSHYGVLRHVKYHGGVERVASFSHPSSTYLCAGKRALRPLFEGLLRIRQSES